MDILGLVLGVATLGVVFWGWYRMYRRVKGEDMPFGPKAGGSAKRESLEDFVAAYRRGEVNLDAPPVATRSAAPSPVPAPVPVPMAPPPAEPPAGPTPFLSGGAKLVYLTCRAGLRDHHLFARVRLATLSPTRLEGALADAEVALLVCNPEMAVVAAIDVTGDAGTGDAAKAEHLRGLGIRYLKLSPRTLPKPEEIRNLLYRL
jgi:hypothetical protein